MPYTTVQFNRGSDFIAFDVRQYTLLIWWKKFPPRFEFINRYPALLQATPRTTVDNYPPPGV